MHDIDLEFEVVDTKFEESYNDASYMTRSANDPTKNGQGFHQDIWGCQHVLTDSEDSNELSSGSSEDEESDKIGYQKKRKFTEFNPMVDIANP